METTLALFFSQVEKQKKVKKQDIVNSVCTPFGIKRT